LENFLYFVFGIFLNLIYPQAQKAAAATESEAQGQFWQMYEILLINRVGNGYLLQATCLGQCSSISARYRRTISIALIEILKVEYAAGDRHPALFINNIGIPDAGQ